MTQQKLWDEARAAWAAAMGEERVYDRDVWLPAYEAGALTPSIDDEMQRLMDRRYDAEDPLLDVPAVNAEQLATKVLIAFDNDRELTGCLPIILNDCRRFADDSLTKGPLSTGLGAQSLLSGGHRGWMAELACALREAATDDTTAEVVAKRNLALTRMIIETPAVTDDDVIARMTLIVMKAAGGSAVNVDDARRVVREAMSHFGLGTTAGFERLEAADA